MLRLKFNQKGIFQVGLDVLLLSAESRTEPQLTLCYFIWYYNGFIEALI